MDELEKLMREQFSGAEEEPPAELWNIIEKRMPAKTGGTRGGRKRGSLTVAAIVVAAIALTTVAILSHSGNKNTTAERQTETHEVMTANLSAANESHSMKTENPVAVTEQHGTQRAVTSSNGNNEVAVAQIFYGGMEMAEQKEVHSATKSEKGDVEYGSHPSDATPQVDQQTVVADQHASRQEPQPVGNEIAEKSVAEGRDSVGLLRDSFMDLTIPNVITPNGDGFNDCWQIPNLHQFGTVQLQIYSAQSQRVYTSPDYHGEFCGDNLPTGNYFYVIVIREISASRRGVLVIKR